MNHPAKLINTLIWLITGGIAFLSLGLGPGDLSWPQIFTILYDHISSAFSTTKTNPSNIAEILVWQVRLPRSLLAISIGAALGCGGAITQGVFRNPLASPNVLGLGSGAAVMVVLGISLGIDELGLWIKPILAASGVLICLLFLYAFSRTSGTILSLLLCGLGLSAFFAALMTLLLSINLNNYEASLKISQWLMGSFDARSWSHLRWGLLPIGLGLVLALYLRKNLDVLYLGQESAASLGVNLRTTYVTSVLCAALLVGTAVSLVGVIGFVGLVVPHVARLLVGPSHGRLIPFSMSLGAGLLLIVDISSRVFTYVYLPPGVITSLIGTPFFLWLIRRSTYQS